MTIRLKPLAVSVAVPLAGGLLSNWLSGDVRAVYESLDLPAFAPPAWIFGVVWPLLYLLLGIAAYLIWEKPASTARTQALTFYGVQLLLNFLWSPLFFRFGLFRFAFWELCALFALAAGHRRLLRDALPAHTLAHGALSLLAALRGGAQPGGRGAELTASSINFFTAVVE